MKKYVFNETQYGEILGYLAEQEELQRRDLGYLTPIVEEEIPGQGVNNFLTSMDELFKKYKADNCLDRYHRDGDFITVGKKDAAYVWGALDGALHLWNSLHKKEDALILDNYRTTDVTETYIVQYAADYNED